MRKPVMHNTNDPLPGPLRDQLDAVMHTPEAEAYAQARDLDDLCFEAGKRVATHSLKMMMRLGIKWHGSLPLKLLRLVSPEGWKKYVTLRLGAFTACVVADLAALRELLTEPMRPPSNLEVSLKKTLAMACAYTRSTMRMDDTEREILLHHATTDLSSLLDHPEWERERFVERVVELPDVRSFGPSSEQKIDFIAKAMLEGTAVNVVAFRRHLERLSR